MSELLYKLDSFQIQGDVYDVYKELGNGFLESVYQECLERELFARDIPFVSQKELNIKYKNKVINKTFKPDIICFDKIILELKGVKRITNEHQAQVINYLKATNMKLGLIVNFGAYPKVEIMRIVY